MSLNQYIAAGPLRIFSSCYCKRRIIDHLQFNSFNFWRDPLPNVGQSHNYNAQLLTTDQLEALNQYFQHRSYTLGYTFTRRDLGLLDMIDSNRVSNDESYPHLARWVKHILSFDVDFEHKQPVDYQLLERIIALSKVQH